jgi:outer membrane protein, multidrug efflux system
MIKSLSPLAALLLLGACAVLEPRYERPAPPVPSAWPEGQPYDNAIRAPGAAELPDWRAFYADPKLNTLIARALEENRDLRVAALNIERARSQYRVQRAQSLPEVSGVASGAITGVDAPGGEIIERQYSAGVGITAFELDFFGRVRGLNRAALQQYLATADARDSAQISLISEVASAYLVYAGDLELLRLAQETLASQQRSVELTQRRFEAGASSQLDLYRARTIAENARADAARFTTLTAQDENLLALLVGAPIPPELRPTTIADVAFGAAELPPGLPSEVLLSRPDIRQSEHLLRSANANIGAARAAFFPSVSISGFTGTADSRFENLFNGAAGAWSFTPQVSIPLFDGGARLSNLGVANADREIAVAQYERAIQGAFREVADALAERGAIQEEVAARQALADAAGGGYRLSTARYDEGIDNYLSLLDSQREYYSAQQSLVTARVARAINFVTLYKSLGGGA